MAASGSLEGLEGLTEESVAAEFTDVFRRHLAAPGFLDNTETRKALAADGNVYLFDRHSKISKGILNDIISPRKALEKLTELMVTISAANQHLAPMKVIFNILTSYSHPLEPYLEALMIQSYLSLLKEREIDDVEDEFTREHFSLLPHLAAVAKPTKSSMKR